jgi:single-strand DNA-binding protein
MFSGNLAKTPVLSGSGDKAVLKFTLISNEYAGKDDAGESRERTVSLQFTAFRQKAEVIARNAMKGDQLIVGYRIENNRYKDKDDNDVYGYDFILESFEFGAPGREKREHFNQADAARPAGKKPGADAKPGAKRKE